MPMFEWQDTLEQMPEAAYFGYQNQSRTPNQKRWFQNQFANVQNLWKGIGARQMMGDNVPSQTFTDFLSQHFAPQGGAAQQWGSMSPGQRGMNFGQFAPPTRWMV